MKQKLLIIFFVAFTMLACKAINSAVPQQQSTSQLERNPAANSPYNEKADPKQDIADALANAQKDGKLVLLDFGANWCPDCLVLATLFEDPAVKPYLEENFYVVHIDVGYWDKNLDTANEYGYPIEKGIPAVVVLSADGKTIMTTKDGVLANARTATPDEILGYLKAWVAKKP